MPDHSQHDFRTTELHRDLLSTSVRVQTNWHVITGAPSSARSTLIDQLAGKGPRTISEIARHYFERVGQRKEHLPVCMSRLTGLLHMEDL
jgi:hypothetical protein